MRTCGTCPFCGLLCGDISFSPPQTAAPATNSSLKQCERAITSWGLAQPVSTWTLKTLRAGRAIAAETALAEVVALLQTVPRTLFAGLGTDVAGVRATIDYAQQVNGILDHAHSDALQTNLQLLQHAGWISTTLSEVRYRADIVVGFGDSLLERFPRLLQLCTPSAEVGTSRPPPKVFLIGTDDIDFRSRSLLITDAETISLRRQDWLSAIYYLEQDVVGTLATPTCAPAVAALAAIAAALKSSQYSAWIWSAADFVNPGDDLILTAIIRLIGHLNQKQRAAVLPLGGSNGDVTAQQVCSWKTGFPLRQSISLTQVDYQPRRYRALDVLRRHDCQAAIYISAFEPIEPPIEFWNVTGPKIIMGHPALKSAVKADYFFPTGIPGIDHDSHLFRGDGVAVISVEKKRAALAPAVADWMSKLLTEHIRTAPSYTASVT